jgi:hypothetical protein
MIMALILSYPLKDSQQLAHSTSQPISDGAPVTGMKVVVIPADSEATTIIGSHDANMPSQMEYPHVDNHRLDQVLHLTKRGWKLFPAGVQSKIPLVKWTTLATDDEQQIRLWDSQNPNCNWAVQTGPASNVFVVDVDGEIGRESLNSICPEALSSGTLVTHTGKPMSFHLWFSYPADGAVVQSSTTQLGPGLDIKGIGGCVVVPPSIHPNGEPYTFDDESAEIMPAPERLIELIEQLSSAQETRCSDVNIAGEIIPKGQRNDTLFRSACALRQRGSTENEILAFLKEMNLRCTEPLPQQELVQIAHSACGYRPTDLSLHERTLTLSPVALYGLAGQVVSTILPHTEANEAALLLHFLAAYGNIIGRKSYCEVDGARHYPNMFFALVGATAKGRKGTSWSRIRNIMKLVDHEWARDCIKGGLSSGEGLIAAAQSGVKASSTGTPVPDTRVFALEPEFARVLKAMGREGNTLSAIIRDAWDTGTLNILVKKNPIAVENAHISIVAHITLEELQRHLSFSDTSNGFANRFLWVQSSRSKSLPEGGNLSDDSIAQLAELIAPAVAFGRKAGLLQRDKEAKELWATVYPGLSDVPSGMFGAATSRAEAQVLRLSMIYALLDCSTEIRKPHLEAALALWKYCWETAQWIFGAIIGDSLADSIRSALTTRSEGMTRSEIMDYFGRHKSSAEIRKALQQLYKEGVIRRDFRYTAGRRAEIWVANQHEE